jgi:hypothetical protein
VGDAALADKWTRARGEVALESDKILPHARLLEGLTRVAVEETLGACGPASYASRSDLQYGWLCAAPIDPLHQARAFLHQPSDQLIESQSRRRFPVLTPLPAGTRCAPRSTRSRNPAIEPWVMGGVARAEESQKINVDQLREMYRKYQCGRIFLGGIKVQTRRIFRAPSTSFRILRARRPLSPHVQIGRRQTAAGHGADDRYRQRSKRGKISRRSHGKRWARWRAAVSPVEIGFKSLLQFAGGESSGAKADAAPRGSRNTDLIANLAIVSASCRNRRLGDARIPR